MNTDDVNRRDFWNLGLNPITMLPPVVSSMSDFQPVYEELKAEY